MLVDYSGTLPFLRDMMALEQFAIFASIILYHLGTHQFSMYANEMHVGYECNKAKMYGTVLEPLE